MFKSLLLVASLTTVSKQYWEQQCSYLLKIVLPSVSNSSKQLLHKPVVWHRFSHAMWKTNVSFLGHFRTFRGYGEQSEHGVRKELKVDDAKCLKTC